jgi:hypothetical protein
VSVGDVNDSSNHTVFVLNRSRKIFLLKDLEAGAISLDPYFLTA